MLKLFPHSWHSYGFSPVCILRWLVRLKDEEKIFVQYGHSCFGMFLIFSSIFSRSENIGLDINNFFAHKIVDIFLPISFNIMFWLLKRTVSLRRFFWVPINIYFGWEIRKLIFWYTPLTKGLSEKKVLFCWWINYIFQVKNCVWVTRNN